MSGWLGCWRASRSGVWSPLGHAGGRWALILGLLIVGAPQSVPAGLARPQLEIDSDQDEEVQIDADSLSYDRGGNQIGASGNVIIRRGDTTLKADEVRFDRRTSSAEAFGNVEFSSVDAELRADHVQLDLDDETGALLGAEVESGRLGYSLRGDRIEKETGQRYHIENGKFTTCHCAKGAPSWSITGKTLDVSLEGYGKLAEARFCILDVPVLYLPRLAIPVHSERQTGILLPEVGFSNQRGFRILQPFYWAINKSQDLTIAPIVETSARIGISNTYRYALRRDLHGELELSYYNESIRGLANGTSTDSQTTATVPENRWAVFGQHLQPVWGSDAYMDLQVVGDDQFFREISTHSIDYGSQLAYRTRPFTTSRIGFLTKWDRVALQGDALVYQDLVGKQAFALQQLPELRVDSQHVLGWGTRAELFSSVTNFQREESVDGVRLDLQPGLGVRLPLGRSFFGSVTARAHERVYQLTDNVMAQPCDVDTDCPVGAYCDLQSGQPGGENGVCRETSNDDLSSNIRLPRTQNRESVELRADLRTEISRVFEFSHFGIDKLKHTVEPQLEYLYVPNIGQGDTPVFDSLDRINHRNLVSYGIASRLLARAAKVGEGGGKQPVYELARFSLIQSYDFERTIAPFEANGKPDHLSDIDVALRINPSRITAIRAAANYDPVHGQMPAATVAVQLFEPLPIRDDGPERQTIRNSMTVSYRFISQDVLQLLQGSMVLRLTDHIGGIYATRYDIQKNRFLENFVGMRYISTCDCWSIDLGVSDTSNPNEVQVRAQVSLLGFGSLGSFGATRGDGGPGL